MREIVTVGLNVGEVPTAAQARRLRRQITNGMEVAEVLRNLSLQEIMDMGLDIEITWGRRRH